MAEVAGRGVAERTGRVSATLPSWASHVAYKLAPPPLLLVQAFVNTIGMGADMLAHAEQAHAWLTDARLIDAAFSAGPASPAFAADLRLATRSPRPGRRSRSPSLPAKTPRSTTSTTWSSFPCSRLRRSRSPSLPRHSRTGP